MKDEILKRAMFAMPLSKEAQGTGIMSGFDMEDMGDDVDENADLEEMPPMARTPQNPEILMNTLRGDMRSVDARYMELAQMVGEEAAMETPPEVLAMLMGQMGAQQAGIGALPQAQGMMPPGAGMPPPDQMGAPQPAPAMPQGGIPMPEGMESAPPFSQGAEEAPQGYAVGGLVRGAQFLGNKASQLGSSANAALGRMFMTPQGISQPYLENVRGAGGKFTAEQVQRGGDLLTPTFTQGIQQGVARLADQYPRATQAGAAALSALGVSAIPRGGQSQGTSLMDQIPRDTREDIIAAGQRPVTMRMDMGTMTQQRPGEAATPIPMAAPPAMAAPAIAEETTVERPAGDDLGAFINSKLGAFEKRQEGMANTLAKDLKDVTKPKTKAERIKAAQGEYNTMFSEILGDDKESAKVNALLLLSEAGLKLASTRKPTFAMALADAASGLPRGLAAIGAQERELSIKGKSAALQQAITDVTAEDAAAAARQLKILEGDFAILKEQAKQGGSVVEDAGLGGRVTKTKSGSFVGFGIDPNDPSVKSAIGSRFTLQPANNPFVVNMGEAPTTVQTDKGERNKLGLTLGAHEDSLKSIEIAKNSFSQLYSPGTFFVDKVNNLLVPLDFTGAIKPNLDQEAAKSVLMTLQNTLSKSIAAANNTGRTAVQEQEWARQLTAAIANPTDFFKDRELAAKTLTAIETSIRNARQQTLTQLGYEGNDYVMQTPNTGTKNDPFRLSDDPAERQRMYTFLAGTVGKLQDPRAVIHVRGPDGAVKPFTPPELLQMTRTK